MSDVAHILGVARNNHGKPATALPPPPAEPSRAMQMKAMSRDVLQILGGSKRNVDVNSISLPPIVPTFTRTTGPTTATKTPDTTATTATTAPTSGIKLTSAKDIADKTAVVKIGNKWIVKNQPARPWIWAPFTSSSRTDGALFEHWVRANVEYPDYPYARFDIHLDPVIYSSDEYANLLQHDSWTKSETDTLMDLARRFELRWPVIHDRWMELYEVKQNDETSERKIEDLQHRYYSVAAKLNQSKFTQEATAEVQSLMAQQKKMSAAAAGDGATIGATATAASTTPTEQPKTTMEDLTMETVAARALASSEPEHQPLATCLGTGSSNKTFDLEYERDRRAHWEAVWRRSKEEEQEEMELRRELKAVEMQLKKLKKSGRHIVAAAASLGVSPAQPSRTTSAASSRNPSRNVSPIPSGLMSNDKQALHQVFASAAPVPTAQTPYLQSGRLAPPATGGPAGLNKTLLTRMETFLEDLKVPKRVLPTKRACDIYDTVRKDVVTLLILQKNAIQKEGMIQSKRSKLSKLLGNVSAGKARAMEEDAVQGTASAQHPPTLTSIPAASKISSASISTANRSKGKTAAKPKTTTVASGGGKSIKTTKVAAATPKNLPTAAAEAIQTTISPTLTAATTTAVTTPATAVANTTTAALREMSSVSDANAVIHAAAAAAAAKSDSTVPSSNADAKETAASSGETQAQKSVAKRKRKVETKSFVPSAVADSTPATATVTSTATSTTVLSQPEESTKGSGKKRVKKSTATTDS